MPHTKDDSHGLLGSQTNFNASPLFQLYEKRGFGSPSGGWKPLRASCKLAPECWHNIDEPDDSVISRPWVGSDYGSLGLVAIGVNFNGGGAIDLADQYVRDAKAEIEMDRKRVYFEEGDYGGTMFWYRLGCYAALFARASGLMAIRYESDGYPTGESISRAFEYIAFLNQIKCSPPRNDARPTAAMWRNCGQHVLTDELRLLKPRSIMVLGLGSFWEFVGRIPPTYPPKIDRIGKVLRTTIALDGSSLPVFATYHPRAGCAYKQLDALLSPLG